MGLFSRFKGSAPSAAMIAPVGDFAGSPTQAPPQSRGMFSRFVDPNSNVTGSQRLQMLGAALSDAGAGLNGQQGGAAARMGQGLALQQEAALKRQEALQKSQQQAQLVQMADQLGMDPRERLIFMADPAKWASANATRLEAYSLSPGAKRGVGGETVDYAPQFMELGDQVGRTTVDGGVDSVFRREPTYAETETATNNDFRRAQNLREFDWQRDYQGGMLGVAKSNAGRGWAAHNARLKGVGGYGTPGVGGGVIGPALDPNEWEIQ
jgi:hypothetical protein